MKLGYAASCLSKVDPEMFDPLRPHTHAEKRVSRFGASEPTMQARTATGQAVEASPDQAAAMFAMTFGAPR